MSSMEQAVAARSVDVLPTRVGRRATRRDGLLPLVFTLELLTGVAFGAAANAGQASAAAVPSHVSLAPAESVPVVVLQPAVAPSPVVRRHAPRNPFGALVRAAS